MKSSEPRSGGSPAATIAAIVQDGTASVSRAVKCAGHPSGAVERGRGQEFQLIAARTPAQGPGILLGLVLDSRPGDGHGSLGDEQRPRPGPGVRSPWASPMRRSRATAVSTSAIGCHENDPRPRGGGLAAEYFPVRRPCRSANTPKGTTPSSRHVLISPTRSGARERTRFGWLASLRPRLPQGGIRGFGSPWPNSSTRQALTRPSACAVASASANASWERSETGP